MSRTATNCQPYADFIPAGRHDCYGGCVGGTVEGCENCHGDHHVGGWQTCPKYGQRKNCKHPACVAVEKEASVETSRPMTGMPAAEFEIDRLQKANAQKREAIAALRAECDTVTRERDEARAAVAAQRNRAEVAECDATAQRKRNEWCRAVGTVDKIQAELRRSEGEVRAGIAAFEQERAARLAAEAKAGLPPLPIEALAERVTALEPLFGKVEALRSDLSLSEKVGIGSRAGLYEKIEAGGKQIASLTSALLDLARLVAIQARAARDTATARQMVADGVRVDAEAIVAKLGGGK